MTQNQKQETTDHRGKTAAPAPPTKYETIIEAATTCFLADGYGATSMDKVAGAACVAKQTLYHHFGSKNGLFEATLQHVTRQVTNVFRDHRTSDHAPTKTLLQFGSDVLDLSLRPQSIAFMRLLIAEAPKHQQVIEVLVKRAIDSVIETLASYLREQTARRNLRVEDPAHTAQMFLGMLAGELRLRALLGFQNELTTKERQRHLDLTVAAFLRAFAP